MLKGPAGILGGPTRMKFLFSQFPDCLVSLEWELSWGDKRSSETLGHRFTIMIRVMGLYIDSAFAPSCCWESDA